MATRSWATMIELPSIGEYSDDNPWVMLRGSEFDNIEDAEKFFHAAKAEHEYPLRLIQRVVFSDGRTEDSFR